MSAKKPAKCKAQGKGEAERARFRTGDKSMSKRWLQNHDNRITWTI